MEISKSLGLRSLRNKGNDKFLSDFEILRRKLDRVDQKMQSQQKKNQKILEKKPTLFPKKKDV